MKSQDHKSTTDEGKARPRPGIKTGPQVKHPILQLQQLVGNKAVTRLIQRHPSDAASNYRGLMIQYNQSQIDNLSHKTFGISNKVDLLEGVIKAQTGRMNRHTQGGGHLV